MQQYDGDRIDSEPAAKRSACVVTELDLKEFTLQGCNVLLLRISQNPLWLLEHQFRGNGYLQSMSGVTVAPKTLHAVRVFQKLYLSKKRFWSGGVDHFHWTWLPYTSFPGFAADHSCTSLHSEQSLSVTTVSPADIKNLQMPTNSICTQTISSSLSWLFLFFVENWNRQRVCSDPSSTPSCPLSLSICQMILGWVMYTMDSILLLLRITVCERSGRLWWILN